MKKHTSFLIIAILAGSLLLAGCGQQSNSGTPTDLPESTQTAVIEPTSVEEETVESTAESNKAEEQPAAEPTAEQPGAESQPAITLSQLAYSSPSNAFQINLPENWNCSETGTYRVDCHNSDDTGMIVVSVTSTGYELEQEAFLSMVHAELVNTYENVKAYSQISQDVSEGTVINEATWREGEAYWQGIDRFVRSDLAVYHLRIGSVQGQFESYRPIFDAIIQNAVINSGVMSGAPLYAFRKEYVSPDQIFNLQVPTCWSEHVDAVSIERTVVEGFLSPDQHAAVQVAIYRKGSYISVETKATKTLQIMHQLYGNDMRITIDKVLPDGREWLEWYAERKGIQGTTYFDSNGFDLYIFSVIWEDAAQDLYKPILAEIVDSFTYEQ